MDSITLDFEQAKTKHLLFKSRLRSILYGLTIDEAPVLSHHECTVGKWIYGHALKAYGDMPEMIELEKVHADIHTSARALVALYKEGKVEEAREGLTDMENIADHLVSLLDVLEIKLTGKQTEVAHQGNNTGIAASMKELQDLALANEKLDKIIKAQSGDLIKERKLLHDFFMQAPAALCILKGKDHVFELVNEPFLELTGHRDIKGKIFREGIPEIEGQGFFELLDNVFNTGITFIGTEMPITLINNNQTEVKYINFSYQAYADAKGAPEGILVFAYNVTEQVVARKLIEESEAKYKALAQELQHTYDDFETKVKFRNIELEREKKDLEKQIALLSSK